jgi:Metal binding domain of Ada
MKASTCCIILTIAAGFLPVCVAGRMESPLPRGNSFLTGRPHPALVGVGSLRIRLLRGGNDRTADGLDWRALYAKITEEFHSADIELNSEMAQNGPNSPELRIYVEVLKLEDSPERVLRIQTSLARAVCLTEKPNPIFKAELWQLSPVMRAVPADKLPIMVTDVVLEQVEAFIRAREASNPRDNQPSDNRLTQMDSAAHAENGSGPDTGTAATGSKYVASKSSSVFHRPDCRWAQNISPENRVSYNSRQEAIRDGKKPCKSCNP